LFWFCKIAFLWRKKNGNNFSWRRRRRTIHEGKEAIVRKIQTFIKKKKDARRK